MQYERESSQDKRVAKGDDFAGDAWRNRNTGEIIHVIVGDNPNQRCDCGSRDTEFVRGYCGTQTVNGYFQQEVDVDIYFCNTCKREFSD